MRLFNFSFMIGTKLAIMSGMGIAMVLIMIGSTVYGNSEVGKAIAFVKVQTDIASDLADAALGLTSARLAVRDILLADKAAELRKAGDDFETRAKATNAIVDKVIERSRSAENRERVQKVKELFAEYISAGKQMMQLRQDFLATTASERRDAIDDQLSTIVKDRAAGAAKMMELADQSGDFAKASAEKAVEVQSDYVKGAYEGFVAEATKLGELYSDLAREAYKPFESQFGKAPAFSK